MARPLRIEFPGAIYHATSRGDRREPIFADDVDRQSLLAVLASGMARLDAQVLAYCLMGTGQKLNRVRSTAAGLVVEVDDLRVAAESIAAPGPPS